MSLLKLPQGVVRWPGTSTLEKRHHWLINSKVKHSFQNATRQPWNEQKSSNLSCSVSGTIPSTLPRNVWKWNVTCGMLPKMQCSQWCVALLALAHWFCQTSIVVVEHCRELKAENKIARLSVPAHVAWSVFFFFFFSLPSWLLWPKICSFNQDCGGNWQRSKRSCRSNCSSAHIPQIRLIRYPLQAEPPCTRVWWSKKRGLLLIKFTASYRLHCNLAYWWRCTSFSDPRASIGHEAALSRWQCLGSVHATFCHVLVVASVKKERVNVCYRWKISMCLEVLQCFAASLDE